MDNNNYLTLMLSEQNYSDLRRMETLYNQALQGLRTINQVSGMLLSEDSVGIYELEKDIYDRKKTSDMPEFDEATGRDNNFYVLNYWDEENVWGHIQDGIVDCHKTFVENVSSYIEYMYKIPSDTWNIWHKLMSKYEAEKKLKNTRDKYRYEVYEMIFRLDDILSDISEKVRIQEAF